MTDNKRYSPCKTHHADKGILNSKAEHLFDAFGIIVNVLLLLFAVLNEFLEKNCAIKSLK
jgi:hypothetical protein